jgi:general stress protein 26
MQLPPLTDEELKPFLEEGTWVAKLATTSKDGTIRITPMHYGVENGNVMFSTWKNSDAVRNVRRSGMASVLIDRPDQPVAGVHYTGEAEVLADDEAGAEDYGRWFQRYAGSYEEAVESYKFLVSLGIGERAFIRFRPTRAKTWDFAKIPGA